MCHRLLTHINRVIQIGVLSIRPQRIPHAILNIKAIHALSHERPLSLRGRHRFILVLHVFSLFLVLFEDVVGLEDVWVLGVVAFVHGRFQVLSLGLPPDHVVVTFYVLQVV